MILEELPGLDVKIHVADIGAAAIAETPPYMPLLDRGLARLSAFDADPRHRRRLVELHGDKARIYTEVIGDGKRGTIYFTAARTGMSSTLKPSTRRLKFFNGFEQFGAVEGEMPVNTKRLDDIDGLADIDFVKLDIQGGELTALRHGRRVLRNCVAIQLEVAFMTLYENQPTIGDVDLWMRSNGYAPHCFMGVKNWSIFPTIREGNVRRGYNQLLEADIVYVKDPINLPDLADRELVTLTLIAHYAYGSIDLAAHLMLELERRGVMPAGSSAHYSQDVAAGA
jgi:FkbM family methyltransferase